MKISATLIRCNRGPVLATLQVQDQILHIVEVTCKGGPRYALGSKQKVGYQWLIGPTDKATLWRQMKETWDVTVAD